jgi:putative ABC transport system permease protein
MIKNYFKIAWRNLLHNKLYSFINIVGLAMGIAAFLLILEYVSFEKSVNVFHTNLPNMYRLINEDKTGKTWTQTEPGMALNAKEIYPEIKEYCRFAEDIAQGVVTRQGDKQEPFRETNIVYGEGNFFSFFSFACTEGKPSALNKTNVVFISDGAATKYFGKEDPVEKMLILSNQFGTTVYTVGGVYVIPDNSDLKPDMVFSLETLKNTANLNDNSWAALDGLGSQYITTFFSLNYDVKYQQLESKLTVLRNQLKTDKDDVKLRLQPFANVHLPASLSDAYPTFGNLKYVYILSVIALMILAIAWFNYINLSTAKTLKRANEVGVRKVIGASQQSLILQFLSESLLVNILGFALGLLLVKFMQSLFNDVTGKNLSLQTLNAASGWLTGVVLIVCGSLLSGAYTAFTLSKFNPVQTLKGRLGKTAKGAMLRKTLVVVQFSISIALILSTLLIYQQLKYMQNKNLGMSTEQLLVIKGAEVGKDSTYKYRRTAFSDGIAQQSFVKAYSLSGCVPGSGYNYSTAGFSKTNTKNGDKFKTYAIAEIDNRYLSTYKINLKAGRNFTTADCNAPRNERNKLLMNEKAIMQMGFTNAEEAVNKKIIWDEREVEIIGVVKDYHHTGLQLPIDPIVFYPGNNSGYFTISLATDNLQGSIAQLGALYKNYFTGNPFEYFFADENFNKQYITEQQYSSIFTIASVWAIIIACLGLFGLTTYSVESRIKEIGIRKVMGASALNITALLSKDFLKLVLIAVMIASAIAWWAMDKWLQDFAYRIHIGFTVFAMAFAAAILIALLTVSYQSIKAAIANPIKSLKSE